MGFAVSAHQLFMNVQIQSFLQKRYPGEGKQQVLRETIASACNDFVESGLADANFINELCSGSESKFCSRISEALLAAYLKKTGHTPFLSNGSAPDFFTIDKERKIWIEVTCPEPTGLPLNWGYPKMGEVIDIPHEKILLRWTSAIKEKAEKLLGCLDGSAEGYIGKGVVSLRDAYVIAVNGYQLREMKAFPRLIGISQFPYAVEAVFAVGPYQIAIDRDSLKTVNTDHQHRPIIKKPSGSDVPAYTFLDERYQQISAIWGVDIDGTSSVGNSEPMVVVHNPNAVNPISTGYLPAHSEYVATPNGENEYLLQRIDGNLVF